MNDGLKKELTLLDVFCVATGAMISSGLFILPGLAFARAGPLRRESLPMDIFRLAAAFPVRPASHCTKPRVILRVASRVRFTSSPAF